MNKLLGTIVYIESSQAMSLVDIDIQGDIFSSIVLETPLTASYLKTGTTIFVLFKETEVSLGKHLEGLISIRNRFKGIVKTIEESSLLTKIVLQYKNTEIVSIISTRSVRKLKLRQGEEIEWLVKTNEVSLFKKED